MPIDDSRLRELCGELDLKFTVEMGKQGTCHVCYLTTTQKGDVRHKIQTPPTFGEQAAFDHALKTLIDTTRWRKKPIPEQYRRR